MDKKEYIKVKLSNPNTLVPLKTEIQAYIETDLSDVEYAWYVYHNGKRIDMKWYSKKLKKTTVKFEESGIYHLKGYIRDSKGNIYSLRTRNYKVYDQREKVTLKLNDLQKETYKYEDIANISFNKQLPTKYEIKKGEHTYDFLIKRNNLSSHLTVVASAAYVPEKFKPPVFHRFSWMNEIEGNVIYFSDPTLYLSDIRVGWGQGTPNSNPLLTIAKIVKVIAEKINVPNKNILYYGSSAGGFMSLVLGGLTEESSVLINNPITIVNKSSYYKKFVEKITESCKDYSEYNFEKISKEFKERQDIRLFYKKNNYVPNIYYLQNAACKSDMTKFYLPFINDYENFNTKDLNSNLISHLYWDEEAQHDPVSKEETLMYIKKVKDMWFD